MSIAAGQKIRASDILAGHNADGSHTDKVSHTELTDRGTNTHATIDAFLTRLATQSSVMSADVTLVNTHQYYDAVSVSLGAGTWLVMATAGLASTPGSFCCAKLWDGDSTAWASGGVITPALIDRVVVISLIALVVLTGTTTVKLSCADNCASSNSKIKAALGIDGAGNNVTKIIALKIAP